MRLNDGIKKKNSKTCEDSIDPVSTNNSINPLQKYVPNPLDANFRDTLNTSTDHEPHKARGRDRAKSSITSRKILNPVDNSTDNWTSFRSSKYRSISCEDARQALNESLVKVSSMQHMLETRR